MDQFDDFNVEEPKQESVPNTGDTQLTNPAYNVVNTVQNTNVQNPNVNASQAPTQTGATAYVQSQESRRVPCPKCGQPIVYGSRYCMHCGYMDFNNAQNQSVKKFFNRGQKMHDREERRKKMFSKFNKKMYTLDEHGVSKEEKLYTGVKKFFTLLLVIAIIVAAINYKAIIGFYEKIAKQHYLKQVDTIIETIEKDYNPDKCKYGVLEGKMYFNFSDSSDFFKVHNSLFTFDHYSGSIQIINRGDHYDYIITMYDGKYGINGVNYSELTIDSVQKMEEPSIETTSVTCD